MGRHAGPLVSVLIPAHNAARWLGETLESVFRQTYRDLEVIVVDDGSEDDTARVAREFAPQGLQLHTQLPSRGQSAAENAALRASQGELIQFLDADDLISPRKIAAQVERLRGRNDCIASGEWGRFVESPDSAAFHPEVVWRDLPALDWLIEACSGGQPMMQAGIWLIPREILRRAGGWDERLSLINDFEFFIRVLLATREVKFCPGARLYYRSGNPDSLASRRSADAWRSALLSLELGTAALLEREDSPRVRRSCAAVMKEWLPAATLDAPEVAAALERHLELLGDTRICLQGGPALRVLEAGLGWRRALRLQRWCYHHGYRRALPYEGALGKLLSRSPGAAR